MKTHFLLATALFLGTPTVVLADACGPDCGRVTAVDKHKEDGKGTGLGAVAGGVAGGLLGHQVGGGTGKTLMTIGGAAGGAYAGHVAEKKLRSKTVYNVAVKLDNGQTRSFRYESNTAFAVGDRVHIRDNRLERYTGQ